mmetsp:Transcript_30662/g.59111  ORF Transcript_30662/g.59111 Transcript_30662/m.59111 type:complete len:252 (-) Transcript_30662:442-1197(-)
MIPSRDCSTTGSLSILMKGTSLHMSVCCFLISALIFSRSSCMCCIFPSSFLSLSNALLCSVARECATARSTQAAMDAVSSGSTTCPGVSKRLMMSPSVSDNSSLRMKIRSSLSSTAAADIAESTASAALRWKSSSPSRLSTILGYRASQAVPFPSPHRIAPMAAACAAREQAGKRCSRKSSAFNDAYGCSFLESAAWLEWGKIVTRSLRKKAGPNPSVLSFSQSVQLPVRKISLRQTMAVSVGAFSLLATV